MKRIFSYLWKWLPLTLLGSFFMVLEVSMDLVQPRMMEAIVDTGILGLAGTGRPDTSFVLHTGIRMILVVVFGGFCGIMSGVCTNFTSQQAANGIRKDCFARVLSFDHQQMDAFSSASLITRITNDVTQVQTFFVQIFRGVVRCAVFCVGGTFALLSLDLSFSKILLIAFPVILFDIIFIYRKTSPLFTVLQRRLDVMNGVLEENVHGFRVVKAFVQENREEKRFGRSNADLAATQYRVLVDLAFMRPVVNIVLNTATVAIIYVGGLRAEAGADNPGLIMAAITYISQILNGMTMLSMIFQNISRGTASGKRLAEVLRTEPSLLDGTFNGTSKGDGSLMQDSRPYKMPDCAVTRRAGRTTLQDPHPLGEEDSMTDIAVPVIRFEDAAFAYPGTNRTILHDINLSVGQGETVAIVGATGSGKSSLVNLIPRFYDVTAGSVSVNGSNVRDWNKHALREEVTVCLQKSELFQDSIRKNIALDDSTETDAQQEERLLRAASDAQALEFINNQADGFDTQVSQAGMSLSGGQKQRIAIARALYHHGKILILDDATSALDLATEAALYTALKKHYENLTTIIVAQRIATARQADRIAVLEGGMLIACGTHENLLRSCTVYRDICDSQGITV